MSKIPLIFFLNHPLPTVGKKRVSISYWPDINMHCKSSIYSTLFNYNGSFSPFKPKCETISCPFYLYSDSFNSFKPKFEKVSALRAQFSLYSGSFLRIPTDFGAASIFLARFRPRLLGKKFAEDLRGLGKSQNILNFIYQCLIWRLLRENNGQYQDF